MRTILRLGIVLGGVGFVVLYALQLIAGVVVSAGVLVIGVLAGLGMAKWIERSWFGRQFGAGVRAGLLACGLAGTGALLSLFVAGQHSTAALAVHSHFLGLDAGPWVRKFAFAGWVGVDILAVVISVAGGTVLAALLAQIIAWSKNSHVIRVVAQARLAAQAASGGDPWNPALVATPGLVQGIPAADRATHVGKSAAPPSGVSPAPSVNPQAAFAPGPQEPTAPAWPTGRMPKVRRPLAEQGTGLPAGGPLAGKAPGPRIPSGARPAEQQLTNEMRQALSAWADESQPQGRKQKGQPPAQRTPKASEYLNSAPPAPKRNRKKQDTRDWLC